MKYRPLTTLVLAAVLGGCAVQVAKLEPGRAQPTEVSERGLWLASRKAEQSVAISGRRVRNPRLEEYVAGVQCRVSAAYCPEIRVYTLQVPDFNAAMAPNGFEQVWTGLLLRVDNEAQLATVLAHETAHYTLRHALEQFQTTRQTANLLLATQLGLLFGGIGVISAGPVGFSTGDIGRLIAMGYLAAYSREQEAEADRHGFELMVKAGYAPGEAAKVWANLIEEQRECALPTPPALFASHPPSKERLQNLRQLAEQSSRSGITGRSDFLTATLPQRGKWLRMELATRHLCRMRVLLGRLIEQGENLGELYYYRGELYRLRGEAGDLERAAAAYRKALDYPSAPVATHRELGRVLWRANRPIEAGQAFRRYLKVAESPDDATMIKAYLERLP
ncbi:MAG: M48 family metalloprotease [Nitrococcus mobilis]|nr:M48 family metalloprotease [Nitrococcus mobilis]